MKRKEYNLLKERKRFTYWYKSTQRVELKKAIRQVIAKIDKELKKIGLNIKGAKSCFGTFHLNPFT
jgi:hypothetical protein